MAQEIERLLATPTMRPCVPARSDMVDGSRSLGLLGSLSSGRALALHHARTAAARPRAAGAGHVAVRSVAGELVTARLAAAGAAALMARPEPVRASTRLADREFGNRTRRRLLPFGPRQRGAD